MRYGMNPHQAAKAVDETGPVRVLSGEPSMINWLDLLNAWMLVRDARVALQKPVAASFKHVSPAGVATAGVVDETARDLWRVGDDSDDTLLSAYVRARDADPKSSFGDVVGLSEACDADTAGFLTTVIADAVIAPGYDPGVVETLSRKKSGHFLIVEVDPAYEPPTWESRDVFGVRLEQERDTSPVTNAVPPAHPRFDDLVLSLTALRYTQSNSMCVARDGMVLGIGAGQQNRVDCTRLACEKARSWWLRRHPDVRALRSAALRRQDLLNWKIRFAEHTLTPGQEVELETLFGGDALHTYHDSQWRNAWCDTWDGLTLASDGFIPFRDNVDLAATYGVTTIIEPGGSTRRTTEVRSAAIEHNIDHITTDLRLFHH